MVQVSRESSAASNANQAVAKTHSQAATNASGQANGEQPIKSLAKSVKTAKTTKKSVTAKPDGAVKLAASLARSRRSAAAKKAGVFLQSEHFPDVSRCAPAAAGKAKSTIVDSESLFDSEDLRLVREASIAWAVERGLDADEIDIVSSSAFGPRQKEALERIARAAGFVVPGARHRDFDVVICGMAAPHTDTNDFFGMAFVNVVIGAGSDGYKLSVMREEDGRRSWHGRSCGNKPSSFLRGSHLELQPGAMFVLDPTVIHCALPVRQHPDNWLVLLQQEVPMSSLAHLRALKKRFNLIDPQLLLPHLKDKDGDEEAF
jgi:hypothetical protein